jgi:sugar phosphate permease
VLRASPPVPIRSRNLAVTLLVIGGCVNYLDRSAVSVGDPEITHSLGFSYSAMGLLLSAFAWSYGLAQIPAGIAVDKFGARKAMGAGMVLWSLAQTSAGFVTSPPQFLAARIAPLRPCVLVVGPDAQFVLTILFSVDAGMR